MPQILAPPKEHAPSYHLRRNNGGALIGMVSNSATLPTELKSVSYVVRGEKSYELSNHLGNVLAVVSDRREAGACTDSLVDFYYADGRSVSDYYPFGMAMDSRTQSAGGYRWGFNGQEKDDEVRGSGNSYDFGMRFYDTRIARFLSVDTRSKDFPYWGTYIFAANNPIRMVDVYGEGPGDRIKKAISFLGIPYKQQGETSLRTEDTPEALQYMDCSELVCRVLAADQITPAIKHMNTTGLIEFLGNSSKFHKSESPASGDIVLWNGHTGIVESYDSDKREVTVLHATKYMKKDGTMVESVVRETYSIDYYKKKGAYFYRPKDETPDGKLDASNDENRNGSWLENFNQKLERLNQKLERRFERNNNEIENSEDS